MPTQHAAELANDDRNYHQPRPAKRAKTYRACDQCIASKTRCDDHTDLGCSRCIKLNKDCSLRHAVHGAHASIPVDTLDRARIAELETRIRQLEATLMSAQSTETVSSGAGYKLVTPSITPPVDGVYGALTPGHSFASMEDADDSYRWVFNERLSAVLDRRGFPCVIAQGHITHAEVGKVYQRWRHRIAPIIPLPSLLSSSSPRPTHPFIVATIIAQSDHPAAEAAVEQVTQAIHRILAGDVSVDAVLGLLILALDRPSAAVPSSTRLIALAYEVGKALGLEARIRLATRLGSALGEPYWASLCEDVILWESVKLYYNVIHICFTPLESIVPAFVPSLPEIEGHNSRVGLAYLRDLYLITLATPEYLALISTAEAGAHTRMPDLPVLHTAWQGLQQRFIPLLATMPPTTAIWLLTVQHSICYRTVKLLQTLPLIIHPDLILPHVDTWGSELCRVSTALLSTFLAWADDVFLPSVSYSSIITSVAVILTVHATVFRSNPHYLEANLDLAHRAEAKLLAIGELPAAAVRRVQEEFVAKWGDAGRWGGNELLGEQNHSWPTAAGLRDTEMDWGAVDLSAWSWLFERTSG